MRFGLFSGLLLCGLSQPSYYLFFGLLQLHELSLHVATMVNKCAAFGCKSGYKDHKQSDANAKVTFHAFPLSNKQLCDRWIRANPRKDFAPSKNSKLYSLHFQPSDFVQERTADSNTARQRRKSNALGKKLFRRYLKGDAVPSVFPNASKYFSTSTDGPRETVS